MTETMTVQRATYAASSEDEPMEEGGMIVGVRYSVGRMVVRTQDALDFEIPFVFCAAEKMSICV